MPTLYMELQSTIQYGSIDLDIEKILETTSMDDFIAGYIKKRANQIHKVSEDIKQMDKIQSQFKYDPEKEAQEMRRLAIESVKNKRMQYKKKSQIFVKEMEEKQEDADGKINLATEMEKQEVMDFDDDFDLLDAKIDVYDVKSLKR